MIAGVNLTMKCFFCRRLFYVFLIPPVLLVENVAAVSEDGGGEKKDVAPQAEIAVISLGPTPPRRYSKPGKRGESVMLLPEAGEVPPSRLYYKTRRSDEKKEEWKPFSISFNNPSPMKPVAAGKVFTLYLKKANGQGYEPYVTIPADQEGSRRVFFLTPSAEGDKPWVSPPRVWVIPLDAGKFQGKQFILQNLSRTEVLHAFGDKVTKVPSRKIISYKRAEAGTLYRLAARYGKQKKIIYNMAVRLDGEGSIHLYALYDANPKTNAGRAVGVFSTKIPVRGY